MIEENVNLGQVLRQPAEPTDAERIRERPTGPAVSPLLGVRWIPAGLAVCDVLCLFGALIAIQVATEGRSIPPDLLLTIGAGTLMWVVVFHMFGLHRSHRRSAWEEFPRIVGACTVGVSLVFLVSFWWTQPITRSVLAWTLLLALSLELLARSTFRSLIQRARNYGRASLRTLIVGTNEEARRLGARLTSPVHGLLPVGYVAAPSGPIAVDDPVVLGTIEELEEAIQYNDVECVFVASTAVARDDIVSISSACRRTNTELRISTNVSDILTSRLSVVSIDGDASYAVKPARRGASQAAVKRTFDLVVGSVALLLALPLIVAIALAIRLTSRGPAFFRQARVTKDGEAFTMYKFRTMVHRQERAMDGKVIDLTQPFFKLEDDPRLTRIGRFLRSSSLDELPQIWNVIRGDMSLVGPRPLPAEQVLANQDFLGPRHEVRGGLTGLRQISGRSDLDSQEAVRMDLFYIENWSLGLDIYILGRTIGAVVSRRGAR